MSGFRPSARTMVVTAIGVLLVVVFVVLLRLSPGGESGAMWVSDIGEPAIVLASATYVLVASRALDWARIGRPWLFLALGVFAYGIGDVVWGVIELGMGRQVPYPGLPDVFYILMYPLVAIGLVAAANRYRGLVDLRRPFIMAAVATAVLAVGVFVGFLGPFVLSQGLAPGEAALSVFYPLADVVFGLGPALAVALVISALGGGRFGWPWWAVTLGVFSFSLGDLGYAYLSARNLYASGSLVDAAWTFAAVAIAVGASLAWDLATPRSFRR